MGVQINGSEGNVIATKGTFSGDVGIGGTLTYEDVTNIDSVGLITARSGIKVTSGDIAMDTAGNITLGDSGGSSDDRLVCGAGSDLQLFHDGTQSYLINATGNLDIRTGTDSIDLQSNNGGENMAKFVPNGAVELYYNNSKKFETTSAGVTVTGHLTVGTATLYSTGNLVLGDSDEIRFGAGEDLKIYHDGSNSSLLNSTGYLNIKTTGGGAHYIDADDQYFRTSGGENLVKMIGDGAVELYHNNVKKLETKSQGVHISGELDIHGHIYPYPSNTYDLGTTNYRWRNIYTNDLHLSNEGSSNDVDGTWGDWTIQEGESDLFLKNNRSGKKYKFNLTEVS